jgi:hypothetical protein
MKTADSLLMKQILTYTTRKSIRTANLWFLILMATKRKYFKLFI